MSELYQSLSHSKWDCTYHVVFVHIHPTSAVKSPLTSAASHSQLRQGDFRQVFETDYKLRKETKKDLFPRQSVSFSGLSLLVSLRMDSPFRAKRSESWTMRSRIASARVGS
jgi:hypothetical protein